MKLKSLLTLSALMCAQNTLAEEDWKGCYLGANAAYADGNNSTRNTFYQDQTVDHFAGSADSSGTLAGLQIGCDTPLNDKWLIGAKATAQTANVDGRHLYNGGTGPQDYFAYYTNDLFTIQGRIGYFIGGSSLVYFQTGWVQANQEYNDTDPDYAPPIDLYASRNRDGWTAGIGFEHKFNDKFSFFTEYNRIDFGTEHNIVQEDRGGLGIDDTTLSIDQNLNSFNVGINYRF